MKNKLINNIYEYIKIWRMKMSEYEIILEEAYSKKLGMDPTAKKKYFKKSITNQKQYWILKILSLWADHLHKNTYFKNITAIQK